MATEQACPPATAQRVLVVEDLPDTRESCRQLLELALRLEVDTAADGAQALAMLAERPYGLVLTDLRMPKVGGLGLLREMRANRLPCTVIVTTGLGSVKEAVEAMRLGAYDYLEKPLDPQRLVGLVERALRERAALAASTAALRRLATAALPPALDRRILDLGGRKDALTPAERDELLAWVAFTREWSADKLEAAAALRRLAVACPDLAVRA